MVYEFKKNKGYYSSLKERRNGTYLCANPLFIYKDKGLFPVYKTSGRQGVMNVNYQELILKDLPEDFIKGQNHKIDYKKINENTSNVLEFDEKEHLKGDDNDEFKGL